MSPSQDWPLTPIGKDIPPGWAKRPLGNTGGGVGNISHAIQYHPGIIKNLMQAKRQQQQQGEQWPSRKTLIPRPSAITLM